VRARRRWLLLVGATLGLAAFLVGALIGAGSGEERAPAPSIAEELAAGELAGQRLIAGWEGSEPPRGLRRMIRKGRVAGLILFGDNVAGRSERAVARQIEELQATPRPGGLEAPLLVMVDQEGGQIRRLPGAPVLSAAEMGERGRSVAWRQGERTAAELRSAGFNVDLAPVLDVARSGSAIARERRAFGSSAEQVIGVGVDGFARGLREGGGVAATAKHFPGLGGAEVNTDEAAQRIDSGVEQLRGVDEAPFEAFAADGGELIMLSLATYPALAERPAAFSAKVVEDELRSRLGFEGVTITDGLGAAAAARFGDPARVARAAEAAGNDILLYSDWRGARAAQRLFARGLRSGGLDRARFEASAERVLALRDELGAETE
jgi:beta-N-acetylhexosaminidase